MTRKRFNPATWDRNAWFDGMRGQAAEMIDEGCSDDELALFEDHANEWMLHMGVFDPDKPFVIGRPSATAVRIYNTKLRALVARIEQRTGDRAPNICDRCEKPIIMEIDRETGIRFDLFDVPDDVWAHYIRGRGIICLPCWNTLIQDVDGGEYARAHGEAVPLWSPEFRRRKGIPADEPSPCGPPPMHGNLTHSEWLDAEWAKDAATAGKPRRRRLKNDISQGVLPL